MNFWSFYGSRRKEIYEHRLFVLQCSSLGFSCFKLCFKLENMIIFSCLYVFVLRKDKLPFNFPSPVFLEACQSACVSVLT